MTATFAPLFPPRSWTAKDEAFRVRSSARRVLRDAVFHTPTTEENWEARRACLQASPYFLDTLKQELPLLASCEEFLAYCEVADELIGAIGKDLA